MGALTKAQMADRLFDELGLNKREAKEIVDMFFGELRISLESNEQVKESDDEFREVETSDGAHFAGLAHDSSKVLIVFIFG